MDTKIRGIPFRREFRACGNVGVLFFIMILNEKFLGFGSSRMVGVLLPRNIIFILYRFLGICQYLYWRCIF